MELQTDVGGRPRATFAIPGEDDTHGYGENHEPGFTDRQGRLLRLSGLIDFDSHLSIGCAGAVLLYLERRRAAHFIPGDPDAYASFRVSTFETFSLKGSM